jgi:hypothetical protein
MQTTNSISKYKDFFDIALHTLPTMAVAVACGFMTDFGLRAIAWAETVFWISIAAAFFMAFMAIWPAREKRQHGGVIPTRQSRLEAYMPWLAIPVYVASIFAFMKLEL